MAVSVGEVRLMFVWQFEKFQCNQYKPRKCFVFVLVCVCYEGEITYKKVQFENLNPSNSIK